MAIIAKLWRLKIISSVRVMMRVENNNVSGQNHDPEQIDLIDLLVQLWRGKIGFAPIFPDTCYHLTHYWLAAVDIPVASDNPVHYADAIRYNAR
ncbi:hypothetical protein U5E51_003322, partial [Escherichia coli]|nr:hypothetical protein [Escherichia coli]EMA8573938.1 hypothetical protein [Escherichia coli]